MIIRIIYAKSRIDDNYNYYLLCVKVALVKPVDILLFSGIIGLWSATKTKT